MALIVPLAQADSVGYHYDGKVWADGPLQDQPVVKGHPVTGADAVQKARTPYGARALGAYKAAKPSWPAAATNSVSLTRPSTSSTTKSSTDVDSRSAAVRAGSSPVLVSAAPTPATKSKSRTATPDVPGSVQVRLAGRTQAQAADVDGLLVGLSRTDGGTSAGRVKVTVEYGSIAKAYGGGWATRLHLVAMPACALTTPEAAACQARTPLVSSNDTAAQTLSASVDIPADKAAHPGARTTTESAAAPMGVAVAAVSGTGGSQGDYTATSLSASGAWSQSASGAFTYNYPIATPASLGGSAPSVALSYNSQTVDGETSARNSQSSWIGDGWSYEPGFIERSYKACDDQGIKDSGDECWGGYNATLSLGSLNGELVRDSDGSYHLQADDGTKIERLTGADNGLWQGEYYRVTTTDGTASYFGLDHAPGTTSDASTNSAWGVPVYHPKSADPCYDAAKGNKSQCDKPVGYRFNLDFVVDPHGNVQRYDYATETNYYNMGYGQVAASGGGGTMTPYIRAGHLTTISYGYQLDDARAERDPAARIVFSTAQRCITSDTVCQASNLSDSTATNWPDVPYDIHCESGDDTSGDGSDVCHTGSPTFWSTNRLKTITTRVKVGSGYKDVDAYDLTQQFPDGGGVIDPVTGKTEHPDEIGQLQAVMWLASVQHRGLDTSAGGSGSLTLDPVTFQGIETDNRVDGLTPAAPALFRPRISSIRTETGESIAVTYADPQCSRVKHTMPASADSNTMACFPVYWHPTGVKDPVSDWFTKSLVTRIDDNDATKAGSPAKTTQYEYAQAAWHRDDSDLTDDQYRTWNDFRGFRTVTTTSGTSPNPITKTVSTYLQGMDGDYKADKTTRHVTVNGVTDSSWLAGTPVETDAFKSASDTDPVTKSITDAPETVSTASRPRTAWTSEDPAPSELSTLPDLAARRLKTSTKHSLAQLSGTKGWRTTTVVTSYDQYGRVTTTDDKGDESQPSQENCTTVHYAPAPSDNPMMLSYPSETVAVSGPCGTVEGATTTLMHKRIFYDGDGSITDPGTFGKLGQSWPSDGSTPKVHSLGNMTAVQTITSYDGSGDPAYVLTGALTYDRYGRITKSLDGAGASTTTSYSPATGVLPTSVSTVNPFGWKSTTTVDPLRGAVTESEDANGRLTDSTFDALGRRIATWLPGRDKADNPNSPDKKFSYSVNGAGTQPNPSTVTTQTLREDGSYSTSVSIYDGMLQLRQQQSTTADNSAGRLITSNSYDSHGWPVSTINSYYDPDHAPSGTMWAELETTVPSESKTVYDGLGRPTESQLWAKGAQLWKSTTSYPGAEETDTTPPTGGQTTATFTNARGQTTATQVKDTTRDRKLTAGTVIQSGSSVASNSVRLTMQSDGNLVVAAIATGATLWSSGTSGNAGAAATVHTDGNLVITGTTGTVLWTSNAAVAGSTGAYLVVGDDAGVKLFNSSGATTLWTANTNGKATAANATTSYTYTPAGQTSKITDAVGNAWTYEYNLQGQLVSQKDPDAGTSSYVYDTYGHLVQTTDPRGQALSYTYDTLGRKTAEYAEPTKAVHDPDNELSSWAFDTLGDGTDVKGLPVSSTRYVGGASGSKYIARINGFNTAYQPTSTTTIIPAAEGKLAGSYTSAAEYTPNVGLLEATSYGADGGLPSERVGYGYDLQGLLTQTGSDNNPYLDAAWYTPFGQVMQSTYGVYGKQLRTAQTYDAATQRLATNTVSLQPSTFGPIDSTTYGYDQSGSLNAVSDVQSTGTTVTGTDTQCFTYDGMGRLAEAWSDTKGITTPAVAGTGQLASCKTAAPSPTTIGGPAPYWQSYTYDLLGDRTQQVSHDTAGNALKNTTQSIAYPSTAAPASLPNQATAVTTSNPTTGTATSTLSYTDTSHNSAGVNAGSVTSRKTSTTGPIISSVKTTAGDPLCLTDASALTGDGTSQNLSHCGGVGQNYTIGTDGTVRVVGKCMDTANPPAADTVVVIRTCSSSAPSQQWKLTASGNLVNVASGLCLTDPSGSQTPGTKQTLHACGSAGQTYTTAATGTGLPAGQGQTFTYDAEGRTASVTTGDGVNPKATNYLYDADGGLLLQHGPSGTILYLFGGAEQLTLNSAGTTVSGLRYYSHPDGTAITRSSGGAVTYQPTNPQNTAQLQVDATSLAITRRSYDPYGKPRGTVPTSWADNHGYLGQPADPTTGLDLLGARNYDPVLGRFLTVDPVFEAGDPNQMGGYAYAGDDPVNGSDPSGLMFRAGDSNITPKDQAQTEEYKCEQGGGTPSGCGNYTPYSVHHGWRHALDVGTSLAELVGIGVVVDAGVDAVGACSATLVIAPECIAAGKTAAGALSGLLGGCADTGCIDGEPTAHGSDDPPAASGRPQHDLATGRTPEEAAPPPPGNPEAGTPAEAARPSSPKSATAKKPVADDATSAEQSPTTSGGKCSFSPDTPVLLDHGKTKPIVDIAVGDKVESADPKTGKHVGSHAVTATWVNYDTDLVDVTVQGSDGKPATLHTTSKHPFWDDTTHKWTPAGKLTPGHALNTDKNLHATVLTVHVTPGAADRYNLTVAQVHTYYVLAGTTPVLVHNCNNAATHDVGNVVDNLDDNVYFHYTSEVGHSGILADDGSLRIGANSAGKVHVTQEIGSPAEIEQNIFIGNPMYAGKAEYMFAFRMPEGVELGPGSQPNELITRGSLKIPAGNVLFHGRNPF
ncbi:intein C-terminal splicing region/intein N-terminal splicing region/RHS repeat-associated core domain-containing protein [Actinacidiphila alni]|uniref:Intein C-terminal splicing region/intein N-terminal splicing region/RHS repeat-associated core domain-containing protein n=1 Tax=Actinacidiphila alni TaxID=380248 RepID=A0A1I2FXM1_9ACTN|nr:polymorphic toxin-type HINT domain-containing protein [Actinacidiphila alni]SFF10135.1 intein C-terminal splicing region/intein N-terminal splicing region/RHS repeat-associated core domain-containing protein [Actinacidiphila alni]